MILGRSNVSARLWVCLWVAATVVLVECGATGFAQPIRRSPVWVLHNDDPNYQDPPFEDTLALYSGQGTLTISYTGLNVSQSVGLVRILAATPTANALVADTGSDRLREFDSLGNELLNVSVEDISAVDVSDTHNIYVLTGTTTDGSRVLKLDAAGKILKSATAGGIDLVVDDSHSALWVVGSRIHRYDLDLNHLWSEDPIAWTAVSVDVAEDGSAWIAERRNRVLGGFDRLLHVSTAGSILGEIATVEFPKCIRIGPDGSIWTAEGTTPGAKLHKYDASGNHLSSTPVIGASGLSVDPEYSGIWVGGVGQVRYYDLDVGLGLSLPPFDTQDYTWVVSPGRSTAVQPIADAGADQHVSFGEQVTLSGSETSELDDDLLTFEWSQVLNPTETGVALSGADTATATFTAPSTQVRSLTFELTVSAPDGSTGRDRVVITILEDTSRAVFVSSTFGKDTNPGTMEYPVRTAKKALELAALTSPPSDVYFAEGTYSSVTTLAVENDMSLHGRFVATSSEPGVPVEGWTRTSTSFTRISGAPTALRVSSVTDRTIIDGFLIESADGRDGARLGGPGENSIGIHVLGCTQELWITNNTIQAGRGGPGSPGPTGSEGLGGDPGKPGEEGMVLLTPENSLLELKDGVTIGELLDEYVVPQFEGFSDGGDGGWNGCSGSGGRGGHSPALPGVVPNATYNPLSDAGFTFIYNTSGYLPGEVRDDNGGAYYISLNPVDILSPNKYVGATAGRGGRPGSAGLGGAGATTEAGPFEGSWRGEIGSPGFRGQSGGAGGGGGGGYPDILILGWAYIPVSGGGGGGGGGGGCGGEGGRGGLPGGGSFGILLSRSSPGISKNRISTTGGGAGGTGGRGGNGGQGGNGGWGGDGVHLDLLLSSAKSGKGGTGGRGGTGGPGGGGSGGGGGDSCGIYWHEFSRLFEVDNLFNEIGVGGGGGPGGAGGTGSSESSQGESGAAGWHDELCPLPGDMEPVDLVDVCPSCTEDSPVTVPSGLGGLSVAVSFSGSDIVLSLISPSERLINRWTEDPDVTHLKGPTFEIYGLLDPEPGQWIARLHGADVPAEGERAIISIHRESVNQAPSAVCRDVTMPLGSDCEMYVEVDDGSFDPDGDPLRFTQDPPGPYRSGETTVTLTVEDSRGASSSCQAVVTLIDEVPPQIIAPSVVRASAEAGCTAAVEIEARAEDNCDPAVEVDSDAPPVFPVGETVVTFTASDSAGNVATGRTTVVVLDNRPPEISCPEAINSASPITADDLVPPAVSDLCDSSPILRNDAPEQFPEGRTVVTWSATDSAGNMSICSQVVTVGATSGARVPGDCNGDTKLDLSDAVCLLGHLFLGFDQPLPCGDGAISEPGNQTLLDSNGDRRADLSDAVWVLSYLFLGGPAPVLGTGCTPIAGCSGACKG